MGLLDKITGFFKKKSRLHCVFIDEIGDVHFVEVKFSNNTFTTKFFGEPQTYIVDHNYILYNRKSKTPIAFYYVNNPNPIGIQHERNRDVDSIGFKKILDSKTIQDLFSEEGQKKINLVLILVIVNIAITIIILLIQFKVIKVGGAT